MCFGIEDVEAAPAILEDTRQEGLADDQFHDDGEVPQLRNVVRVILSVKSDRGF